MPKLFDLIGMTDELNKVSVPLDADFKIPDTIQVVDNQTQECFNTALKEHNLEDLKLTARKRLILIDSAAELETSITTTPVFPITEPLPTFKRKKSDRAVVVSIKDQLKKKARRKLAAASKRKNR